MLVLRLTNQRANDVCHLLCNPICNRPPTGYNGPEGAPTLHIWEGHKTLGGGIALVRYFPVTAVTESSLLSDLLICLSKFVFKFTGGVLIDML